MSKLKEPFASDLNEILKKTEVRPAGDEYIVDIDGHSIVNRHKFHSAYALLEYSSFIMRELNKEKDPAKQVQIVKDVLQKYGDHFAKTIKTIMEMDKKPKIHTA